MLLYIRLWAGDGDGARMNRELRNHYIVGEGIDLLRCLLKGDGFRRPKSRLTGTRLAIPVTQGMSGALPKEQ